MAILLIVSDRPSLIDRVRELSAAVGDLAAETCATTAEARTLLAGRDDIHVILVHLPDTGRGPEITEFLGWVARSNRPCPAVVLADVYQDVEAIASLRAGAADYLSINQDFSKLALLLEMFTVRLRPAVLTATRTWTAADPERDPFYYIVAADAAEMLEQVRRVAAQSTTLLLSGEAGTGKTRLARQIHDLSPRRDRPFLVVDCAAPSGSLLESELFGHAAGAFSGADRACQGKFAAAGDGTLLLDAVHALPLPLQGKLLRALDERVFESVGGRETLPLEARIIASSNVPLDQEVLAGRFRADLCDCLNAAGFFLPPLREQRNAIASLSHKFLAEFAGGSRAPRFLPPAVLHAFKEYDWPGNVRELRNVLERTAALGRDLTLDDIPERIAVVSPERWRQRAAAHPAHSIPHAPHARNGKLHRVREQAEIEQIRAALDKHQNNRLRAALELGISRMGLYKKLHKYGLLGET